MPSRSCRPSQSISTTLKWAEAPTTQESVSARPPALKDLQIRHFCWKNSGHLNLISLAHQQCRKTFNPRNTSSTSPSSCKTQSSSSSVGVTTSSSASECLGCCKNSTVSQCSNWCTRKPRYLTRPWLTSSLSTHSPRSFCGSSWTLIRATGICSIGSTSAI